MTFKNNILFSVHLMQYMDLFLHDLTLKILIAVRVILLHPNYIFDVNHTT